MCPWLKENSSKCHPHSCAYIVTSVLRFYVFLPISPFGHDQRMLVQVCLVVDLLLCKSLLVTLDTRTWLNGWSSWLQISRSLVQFWLEVMVYAHDVFRQSNESDISDVNKSPITRKSVKMVAELDHGTAQWIFDNPRSNTVFDECNMTGEQQTATPTVSAVQTPPFTAEQQSFLEEFMMVQHRNHEAAIHQLQASHAEELRMIKQETEDAKRTEHMRNRFDLNVGKPSRRHHSWSGITGGERTWACVARPFFQIFRTSAKIRNAFWSTPILILRDNKPAMRFIFRLYSWQLEKLRRSWGQWETITVTKRTGYSGSVSNPKNYGKHLTSLTQILKFDFGQTHWVGGSHWQVRIGDPGTDYKEPLVYHYGRESTGCHPDALARPMWREARLGETASDCAWPLLLCDPVQLQWTW